MFRNLLKAKRATSLVTNSFFKTTKAALHSYHNKPETFSDAWATMTESSRKLTALVEVNPKNPEIMLYKGHALKEQGELSGAALSYKEAAEMDPKLKEKANNEIEEIEQLSGKKYSRP
jgi:Flp pilus assembly protein TadD